MDFDGHKCYFLQCLGQSLSSFLSALHFPFILLGDKMIRISTKSTHQWKSEAATPYTACPPVTDYYSLGLVLSNTDQIL